MYRAHNVRQLAVYGRLTRPYARPDEPRSTSRSWAGPAGITAALAARVTGVSVVLIDEYATPGGQIWRRRFDEVGEDAPPSLPARAATSARELAASASGALRPFRVGRARRRGPVAHRSGPRIDARAIVLATGAYDRPVAFPGWTLRA